MAPAVRWTERLLPRTLIPLTISTGLLLSQAAPGLGVPLGAGPAAGADTAGSAAATLAISPVHGGDAEAGDPAAVPLECRLGSGPWQPCRMEVEELGSRWSLVVGSERVRFRHDGRGAVTMQRGGIGPWRGVLSRWEAPRQLCWDGVCARGEIPLD